VHDAGHALRHQVVAGALGVGPVLAEAGDRAIDQPRAFVLEALIVEAEFGEPADLEVLDQDVGFGGELAHEAAAFLALEVELDRTLAAVGGMEIGRADRLAIDAFDERRTPAARVVAGALALDLDDVGAEVGEHLPGPGSGENAGEFENAEARQWLRHDETLLPAKRYETEMLGRRYRAIDLPWPVAELSIRTIGLPARIGSAYGARALRPLSYGGAAIAVFAIVDAGGTFGTAVVLKKNPWRRKHEAQDIHRHGRRCGPARRLGAGADDVARVAPVPGRQGRHPRRHGPDDRQGSRRRQCRPDHPGLSGRLAVQAERPVERHGQRPARP